MGVALTPIGRGTVPGDNTGDAPYVAAGTINSNFDAVKVNLDKIEIGYTGQTLTTTVGYTLVLTDAGKMVDRSYATPCTLSIPDNSVVAFPIDTRIDIVQSGLGRLTVNMVGTDTLLGDTVSYDRYKGMSLWKKSATVWVVFGGTV
jgi:hypothetical protein